MKLEEKDFKVSMIPMLNVFIGKNVYNEWRGKECLGELSKFQSKEKNSLGSTIEEIIVLEDRFFESE